MPHAAAAVGKDLNIIGVKVAEECVEAGRVGETNTRVKPTLQSGQAVVSHVNRGSMYFFVRTQNPRPTFHLDMTTEERSIMERHVAYWSQQAEEGVALVFGPVMDPAGVYGIGVYRVDDEAQMDELVQGDPARGLLSYEVHPMARVVTGKLT